MGQAFPLWFVLSFFILIYNQQKNKTRFCEPCNRLFQTIAKKLSLIFKLHPRDYTGQELIKSNVSEAVFLSNEFAFESYLMQSDRPAAIVGFRTSSMHILKALFPEIECLFFETGDTAESLIWNRFLVSAGINKINSPLYI